MFTVVRSSAVEKTARRSVLFRNVLTYKSCQKLVRCHATNVHIIALRIKLWFCYTPWL